MAVCVFVRPSTRLSGCLSLCLSACLPVSRLLARGNQIDAQLPLTPIATQMEAAKQRCEMMGIPWVEGEDAVRRKEVEVEKAKTIFMLEAKSTMAFAQASRSSWWSIPDLVLTFAIKRWIRGPHGTLVASYTFCPSSFDMLAVNKPAHIELSAEAVSMLE